VRSHAATAITILLAAAFTACGGEKRAATPAAPPSAIPEELTGIWETRILDEDWTLKFLGTGGEDNGPSVFLSNDRRGELAGPISVSGHRLTLKFEPTCRRYRFEVGRGKLFLLPDADRGGCLSSTISSVLAARRWTRPGAPTPEQEWPLERIRREGSPGDEMVMESGLRAREYVVCDGPRAACENDRPLRAPFQSVALEVTQDGQSALFSMAADVGEDSHSVTAFDETSVFAMDDAHELGDPSGLRYRLLRVDGTEVPLKLVTDTVPAVPGTGVLVIDFSPGADPETVQHAFLVDERNGTLRPLDVPRNADLGLVGRYWGPNTDEFLWFVDVDCRLYWIAGGTLEKRRLDCADDFEFNWKGGDFTYVRGEMFPDGWLRPGRMALLERTDDRLFLHVSLDRGTTWQRIRVSDESAVPDTLRQLG
jgi:hypothetical protein